MQKLRAIEGKYLVRGTIGSGGMGVVLEAEHIGLGRVVAIKVLHPHLGGDEVQLKRFMREARTAGMCGHPNVAVVYDAGTLEDGRPYIVMERLYGQSLAQRIGEGRMMAAEDAIDIVIQALSALDAVHRSGVVHRDVKPDNVFLVDRTADGARPRPGNSPFVKVLDFGTSKPISGGPDGDLTGTGIAIGTAFYMSPEQARGERDLDGRVDVFACGVMLYEMLTGVRPFTAPSEHGVLLKILSDDPPPISTLRRNVLPELDVLVKRAMARDREARFQSAEEFITALDEVRTLLADVATSSRARPLPPAAPLPDSVRVPVARNVMGSPPSSRTATVFDDDLTPIHSGGEDIRALARAAAEGTAALKERAASAPVPVVRAPREEHGERRAPNAPHSPPSEPTLPISSGESRALAARARLDPIRQPSPTAPTRRVDPATLNSSESSELGELGEDDSDLETTVVVEPRSPDGR